MNTKEFFGKFKSGYLLGHLLAMVVVIILLCIGVWYGLRVYTHHGEGIRIPDLTGMNSLEARRLLEQNGLDMVVNDSGYNKRMPSDCVLAQLPAAGLLVKTGRTVYVTVNSLHSPRLPLPDLIDNSSYREAQARLQAIGFRLLDPKVIDGEKDWVYGIQSGGRNLQTGDMVSIESPLTLVIGRGNYGEEDDDDFDPMNEMIDGGEDDEVDDFLEVPDLDEE
jgi:beta-lactam-binding protein with PASTA domain